MTITYERLRDDDELRREFNSFSLADKREIFSRMAPPADGTYSDEDLKGIQKAIMMKTSEADSQVPLHEGTTTNDIPLAWSQVPGEALRNFDDSAVEYGKNLWQAMRHPIQTGQQLYGLMAGAVEKAVPGGEDKHAEILDNTIGFFRERYGGSNFGEVMESVKKTMAEDPVGFLSDLSVVVSGGSSAALKGAQVGGKLAKVAKIASDTGKVSGAVKTVEKLDKIMQVAQFADPVAGVGKGVQQVAGRVVKPFRSAERVNEKLNETMQSVMGFDPKARVADNFELAQAFLERGVNITKKDLKMFQTNQLNLGKEMQRSIDMMQKTGKKFPSAPIAKAFDNVLDNMEKFKISGSAKSRMRGQLIKLKEEWLALEPSELTPGKLNEMKQALSAKYDPKVGQEFGKLENTIDDQQRRIIGTIIQDMFPEFVEGAAKDFPKRFTKKRKKGDFTSPSVKGETQRAGRAALDKEFGIQKDIAEMMDKVINQKIVSPSSGSKGLVIGGAANVGVGVGAGLITGSPLVGAGSAIGYTVLAHYLSKMYDNPAIRLGFAKKMAKQQNIRISVAKKIIDQRVRDYTSAITDAQQSGRIANIQEQ